jgi:hypothetical protein
MTEERTPNYISKRYDITIGTLAKALNIEYNEYKHKFVSMDKITMTKNGSRVIGLRLVLDENINVDEDEI